MIAPLPPRHVMALVSATLMLGACAAPGYYDQYGGPIPNGVVLSRMPANALPPPVETQPVPAPAVVATPQATAEALRQPQRYAPFPQADGTGRSGVGAAGAPRQPDVATPQGYPAAAAPGYYPPGTPPPYYPPSTVPAPAAGAPPTPYTGPLSAAEKRRYDQIDQQVLRDQDRAIREDEIARTVVVAPAPVYPVAYPGWYGPGWAGPAWGPGWGPGWGRWHGGGWGGRRGGWSVGYGYGW